MTRRDVTAAELERPLLDYADAVGLVAESFSSLAPVATGLADALGLVLGESIVAGEDIPAFDNSAMDGYAARSVDCADGGSLGVGAAVADGVAVKVMTGHPIPDGADAVIPWEQTTASVDGSSIIVDGPVASGRFVRPRGEDVRSGDTVIEAGTRLGPVEIGMLAALGVSTVTVHPTPRVAVLSSGDELVDIDDPIGRGSVRDANSWLLRAACTALGATVAASERAHDDPDAIAAALARLATVSDLIVTSGGASVGEHDFLRSVLERDGELDFWKVALRPGKPVALGSVAQGGRRVPVIVLPGNPGSVAACSHVFVGRAIRRLAGRPAAPAVRSAVLRHAIAGDDQRTVVHPVVVDGTDAVPAPLRSSQALSNAVGMSGWVIVAPGGVHAGATVEVELTT